MENEKPQKEYMIGVYGRDDKYRKIYMSKAEDHLIECLRSKRSMKKFNNFLVSKTGTAVVYNYSDFGMTTPFWHVRIFPSTQKDLEDICRIIEEEFNFYDRDYAQYISLQDYDSRVFQ